MCAPPRLHLAPSPSCSPSPPPPGQEKDGSLGDGWHVGAGGRGQLTIMFSRACLASQQFRNTGMKRFRSGAQKICGETGQGAGLVSGGGGGWWCERSGRLGAAHPP